MNFVSANHMILGYALIAWPQTYDVTGRNTFIVSNAGTIYQKDMGADTSNLARSITVYDPDVTWSGGHDD